MYLYWGKLQEALKYIGFEVAGPRGKIEDAQYEPRPLAAELHVSGVSNDRDCERDSDVLRGASNEGGTPVLRAWGGDRRLATPLQPVVHTNTG